MDGLNDQSLLDVRKLISGKDGRLFVTTKAGTNIFLAEVDTFAGLCSQYRLQRDSYTDRSSGKG